MEVHADLSQMPELQQLRDLAGWAVDYFEKDLPRIYLKCDQETMLTRLISRSRAAENQIRSVPAGSHVCMLRTCLEMP